MPKDKSEYERAIGQLISVIQKEWGTELGGDQAEISEDVLDAAHSLLQVRTIEKANSLLMGRTVRQYLGDLWVQKHPAVKPAIEKADQIIKRGGTQTE